MGQGGEDENQVSEGKELKGVSWKKEPKE